MGLEEGEREGGSGMDVGGVQIAGYLFSRIFLPLRQTSSCVHVKSGEIFL